MIKQHKNSKFAKKTRKTQRGIIKKAYGRDEVEMYVDQVVQKVENNLLPRILAIDNRDSAQFLIASTHTAKYDSIIAKQELLQTNQGIMRTDIDVLSERSARVYEDFVPSLKEGMDKLHFTIDTHIKDELKEFQEIRENMKQAADHVQTIQETLDNVSANGTKGLSASISDVFNKIGDLEKLTEGARARAKFWVVLHSIVENTPLLKPFKSKWGSFFYIILIVLTLNTIMHSVGIDFDITTIIKWLFSIV